MMRAEPPVNTMSLITFAVAPVNLHVTWQQNGGSGKLSLVDNGTGNILTSFNLVGQYDQSDFTENSDGVVGTQISITNPSPPAGTTAAIILRDFNTGVYEIYDIGGNTILSAHALGQVGLDWGFAGIGHFFGSDTSDMLLRNGNTGAFEVYDIRRGCTRRCRRDFSRSRLRRLLRQPQRD